MVHLVSASPEVVHAKRKTLFFPNNDKKGDKCPVAAGNIVINMVQCVFHRGWGVGTEEWITSKCFRFFPPYMRSVVETEPKLHFQWMISVSEKQVIYLIDKSEKYFWFAPLWYIWIQLSVWTEDQTRTEDSRGDKASVS